MKQTRHGHTCGGRQTPTYRSWHSMKDRCLNPRTKFYANYGGRGIKVCEQWMRFAGFLADMGEKPDGTSLDRINVNGNYEPGNCRWASNALQFDNSTRTVYVTLRGTTKTLSQWARELGMDQALVRARLAYGWKPEDAFSLPSGISRYKSRSRARQERKPPRIMRGLTINGETKSIREWSRVSGIRAGAIRERLRRGWTPERAVALPAQKQRHRMTQLLRPLTYQGRTQTLERWASELEIETPTLIHRLRRGWTVERALSQSVQPKRYVIGSKAA